MPSVFSFPDKIKRANAIAFGITAKKYCPNHGTDALSICNECYADDRNLYRMPNVKKAFSWRGELTKRKDFPSIINWELEKLKQRPEYFRIHDSGDFYRDDYVSKWHNIVANNKDIHFYCYIKEVKRFLYLFGDNLEYLPDNWTVCFSYGGKEDHLINPEIHRHSYVFPSLEHLQSCGYVDASTNDLELMNKDNHRIGLVYH